MSVVYRRSKWRLRFGLRAKKGKEGMKVTRSENDKCAVSVRVRACVLSSLSPQIVPDISQRTGGFLHDAAMRYCNNTGDLAVRTYHLCQAATELKSARVSNCRATTDEPPTLQEARRCAASSRRRVNVPSYCSAAAGMFIVQRCVDATTFTYRSDERELKVEITVDEVFEFERSPTNLPHLTRAGQDSSTLNILGSAVSNFIGISDGCIMPSISIEELA